MKSIAQVEINLKIILQLVLDLFKKSKKLRLKISTHISSSQTLFIDLNTELYFVLKIIVVNFLEEKYKLIMSKLVKKFNIRSQHSYSRSATVQSGVVIALFVSR